MATTEKSIESLEENITVLETLTDPELENEIGFDIFEKLGESYRLNSYSNAYELGKLFRYKSPELNPLIDDLIYIADSEYSKSIGNFYGERNELLDINGTYIDLGLKALEQRFINEYNVEQGLEDDPVISITAAVERDGQRFFREILPSLNLSGKDKISIAHVTGMLFHPGENSSVLLSNDAIFNEAADYLLSIYRNENETIEDFKGDTSSESSFTNYIVNRVNNVQAGRAISELLMYTDEEYHQDLVKRKEIIADSFSLDLAEYLNDNSLDWIILPPGISEKTNELISEAEQKGWSFNKDRYLFLEDICQAGNGVMYRSEDLKTKSGFYLATVLQTDNGYLVIADNPFNTEKQENAVYTVKEEQVLFDSETGNHFAWDKVISQYKSTAKALGARPILHTAYYKQNVMRILPGEVVNRLKYQVTKS